MNSNAFLLKMSCLAVALSAAQSGFADQPWSQDRQWLLGDWNGQRQQLEKEGYKFNLNVMNQTATVLGGLDHHPTKNANQVALGANFDLAKIAGLPNTTAALTVTKRDGRNIASNIGMNGSPTEIYGRGNIWRLTQAWIKTGFLDNTLQFKLGRMGMSEDFNGSHCNFQSLILCGGQVGKSQGDVWYNGPVSGWAANVKYQFLPEWTFGVGVYENNPENTEVKDNANFNLSTDRAKGVLIPVELAWKTKKLNGLAGEYKVGGFWSSHDYDRVDAQAGHDPKSAIWLNTQQQLSSNATDSKGGLYGAVNLVWNNDKTANISDTQQIAFWYKGALPSRPADQIGFGVGRYKFNDQIPANHDRDDEMNVELNYVYNYSPAVMLRPNIQYVYQSRGNPSRDNVWVAGISVGLNF